jgi:hypothetical protein
MSEPIASSFAEVLLLLNKWHSEATRIVLLQSFMCPPAGGSELMSGILSRTTGRIVHIEEFSGTFTFASDDKDFAMISPTGCVYGFNANSGLPPKIAELIPSAWDSFLSIVFPNEVRLFIFAL